MASYPIYLDYNATTPMDPLVIEEITQALHEAWGNPSSNHSLGIKARNIIETSRDNIAKMINAKSTDIIFTSGGTEANNMAIRSAIKSFNTFQIREDKPHVITSNVEHDSVIKVLKEEEKAGKIKLSLTNVNSLNGCIVVEDMFSLVQKNTRLISVMHANNETGVIMPIESIAKGLKTLNKDRIEKGLIPILFHTDAAQTLGKIKVDVQELGIDFLTIVGHKFYAPRIGALYARNVGSDTLVYPVIQGGGQERGLRPGTENTSMIAGLGIAAKLVNYNLENYNTKMKLCRDYLSKELQDKIPKIIINFPGEMHLPNTLSVRLPEGLLADLILKACNDKIFASVGAACHSHNEQPSGILISSGLSSSEARRTLRLSVGRETTHEELDLAVHALKDACKTYDT